jgi:hypothetical protein
MHLRRALFGLAALLVAGLLPGLAAAQDPSFFVVNRSGRTINEVYVWAATAGNQGADLLGANVMPSGQRLRVYPGQCQNNIRVVFDNGQSEVRQRVNTCNLNEVVFGTAAAGPAPLTGADFRIVNRSNRIIQTIQVSSNRSNDWGPDLLGNEVLQPGRFWTIRPTEGGCTFDIRVRFADGGLIEQRNINACQITEFTVR